MGNSIKLSSLLPSSSSSPPQPEALTMSDFTQITLADINKFYNDEVPQSYIHFRSLMHGQEQYLIKNKSWYNPVEVRSIIEIVAKLIKQNIDVNSICIVTPYEHQCTLFKEILKPYNFDKLPEICLLDNLKQDNNKIIFVSTVRTSPIIQDKINKKILSKFAKKLNDLYTTNKSLLLIFGCAESLKYESLWKKLIKSAKENGTYGESNYI